MVFKPTAYHQQQTTLVTVEQSPDGMCIHMYTYIATMLIYAIIFQKCLHIMDYVAIAMVVDKQQLIKLTYVGINYLRMNLFLLTH